MRINLSEKWQRYVEEAVASGRYQSVDELIERALHSHQHALDSNRHALVKEAVSDAAQSEHDIRLREEILRAVDHPINPRIFDKEQILNSITQKRRP